MNDLILDETELVPYAEGKLSCKSPNPGEHQRYIMFGQLMELQPRDSSGGGDGDGAEALSPMAIAEALCNDICDVVRDIKFPVEDIQRSLSDEEKGPYQFVFLQECTYMGALTGEMLRSLLELQLGFKGELTMSQPMEDLMNSLYLEQIPTW